MAQNLSTDNPLAYLGRRTCSLMAIPAGRCTETHFAVACLQPSTARTRMSAPGQKRSQAHLLGTSAYRLEPDLIDAKADLAVAMSVVGV